MHYRQSISVFLLSEQHSGLLPQIPLTTLFRKQKNHFNTLLILNKYCTFLHILQMFLLDHQVFPEGLQESVDFASSAQSTAELN